MPPAGEMRLRLQDEGITLLANQAPRGPLLDVLALRLGFELAGPALGHEPVSVDVELAPLEDVLRALLRERGYRLDYRYDPDRRRHEVARLEVLPAGPSLASRTQAIPAEPEPEPAGEPPGEGAGAEPDVADADGDAEDGPTIDWKKLVARLDDSDPDERIEALETIDPEGEGLPLIVDRLARDPDPRVRVVAAEKLEFSDTLAGVDALVSALGDPDKDVVLAAIEALELTDDYTVTQDLGVLLEHPDPEIRRAAREAIDFIEPDDEGD